MAKKSKPTPPSKSESPKLPVPRRTALPAKRSSTSKSVATIDPLQRYMMEVGRYPLLSLEEEQSLVNRYKIKGDLNAAKKLVTANLRLVIKIVMEFKRAYSNVLDMIQEGNLGLLRAVEKYDMSKGTRFSYYASWWIRAYIIKHIIDNFRLVKIGTTHAQQKLFFNLMKEKNRMEAMGFKPTDRALSERLQVSEKEIQEMESRLSNSDVSLDAPISEGEGKSFIDFIADHGQSAEDEITQRELKETLFDNLDSFTHTLKGGRELDIFKERLLAEVPTTLQEIADRYGITRERVRQIETNITKRLKTYFQEKYQIQKETSQA